MSPGLEETVHELEVFRQKFRRVSLVHIKLLCLVTDSDTDLRHRSDRTSAGMMSMREAVGRL